MYEIGNKVFIEFTVISKTEKNGVSFYGLQSDHKGVAGLVSGKWLESYNKKEDPYPELEYLRQRVSVLEDERKGRIKNEEGNIYATTCRHCGRHNIVDPAIFEAYEKDKGIS